MDRIIISGIALIAIAGAGLVYDSLQPPQLDFTSPPPAHSLQPNQQQGPQHIAISSLGINQAIVPGLITNNIWSVADAAANHLATSAVPGEAGNIIVYGHDDQDLFGPLEQAQVGQIITLTAHDGQAHHYRIETITTVNPHDVSLVQPTDDEILTAYTCTGFANSRRLIIQARPQEPAAGPAGQPS